MGNLKAKLNICNNIAFLRASAQLTQKDLAEKIDVTRATINAIERGNYNPSLELAFRLAEIFATDIESIFYVGEKS